MGHSNLKVGQASLDADQTRFAEGVMSERVSSHAELLTRAKQALQMTSEGIGEVMGVSRRTMSRRWVPSLVLDANALQRLATAVLPADRSLAEDVASAAGTDLEAWGLIPRVAPPQPPAPAPVVFAPEPPSLPASASEPEPAPAAPPPPHPRLVDSVVCAAADLLNVPPQGVRPALHAAFRRAQELGLDLETVVTTLAPKDE